MGGKIINGVSVQARLMAQKINEVGLRRILLACAGRTRMDLEKDVALLRSVAKLGYAGAGKQHGVSRQRAEQVTKEFYRCALLVEKGISPAKCGEIVLDSRKLSAILTEHQMNWGDLVKDSGLVASTLSRIKKSGRCRTSTIGKIAWALGVPIESILIK